jgi:hypothetical protein
LGDLIFAPGVLKKTSNSQLYCEFFLKHQARKSIDQNLSIKILSFGYHSCYNGHFLSWTINMLYVNVTELDGKTKKELIVNFSPSKKKILELLEKANILTRENFTTTIEQEDDIYDLFPRDLESLAKIGQLNQRTFSFMQKHRGFATKSSVFCWILELLHPKQLLDDRRVAFVSIYPSLDELWRVIMIIEGAGLLNDSNLEKVLSYKNPINVAGLIRNFQQNVRALLTLSEPQPNATPNDLVNEDHDLYWQIETGLRVLLPVLSSFSNANLLTQAYLDLIFAHPCPSHVKGVIKSLSGTGIELKEYLIRILNHTNIEFISKQIGFLKAEGMLYPSTFELLLDGFFDRNEYYEESAAVKFLIEHDLLTPLNLSFIKRGSFVHFGVIENENSRVRPWHEALQQIKENDWIQSSPHELPKVKASGLISPIACTLNELFQTTTEYLYKVAKNSQHHAPLCRELLLLQERLYKAYAQYKQDGNAQVLRETFRTHISASRVIIEKSYSLTEKIAELFNKLLNAVQSLVTSGQSDRPWGSFFAQGKRALLMADLLQTAEQSDTAAQFENEEEFSLKLS